MTQSDIGGQGGEDEGDGAHRRPGRPRDPGYDKVILDATLEILNDKGYAGLTIDGVAARTGVGRPTIYRRWWSKPALVIAALTQSPRLSSTPDTGALRDDLLAFQRDQVKMMDRPASRRITAGLVADLVADPELAETYLGDYVGLRQDVGVGGAPAGHRTRRTSARRRLVPDLRPVDRSAFHALGRARRTARTRHGGTDGRPRPDRIRDLAGRDNGAERPHSPSQDSCYCVATQVTGLGNPRSTNWTPDSMHRPNGLSWTYCTIGSATTETAPGRIPPDDGPGQQGNRSGCLQDDRLDHERST